MDTATSGMQHNIYRNKDGPHQTHGIQLICHDIKSGTNQIPHQAAVSPPKKTLLKAISNKTISTWPGFTKKAVQKYLPDLAPATKKGHTKRQKQGIMGNKKKIKTVLDILDINRDIYLQITTDKEN